MAARKRESQRWGTLAPSGSAQAEAGQLLIASLRSPDVAATDKIKGLDPG
jgi:hypothetical protein